MSLHATAFWLTYSQSGLTKDEVLSFLQEKGTLKRACVCQEHHEDGGLHIHALAEYLRKKNVVPKHFDLKDEHPNVKVWQHIGLYDQWLYDHWQYCYKEDQSPLVVGDVPTVTLSRKRPRDELVMECVEVARNDGLQKAQERALALFPDAYAKSLVSYDKLFMRLANVVDIPPARPLTDFNQESVQAIQRLGNWQNLFIWGPSKCGKTQFARALLPNAVVVRHKSQLVDARFKDGIIFDDFSVAHWPATAVIALVDWEVPSGIDVKHGHVVIPAKTRKIFTFNEDLSVWCRPKPKRIWVSKQGDQVDYDDPNAMTDEQYRAVRRRFTTVYHVSQPLYGGSQDPPTPEWGDSIPE